MGDELPVLKEETVFIGSPFPFRLFGCVSRSRFKEQLRVSGNVLCS